MNSIAIILVLGSAVLSVARDFMVKSSSDKQIFLWWGALISFFFTTPIVAYILITQGLPDPTGIYIAIGASFIHPLYWYWRTKAYDGGDLSHVYPIIRSAPALILLFAIFLLHEQVSITGIIGILVVTVGVYIINLKKISFKALAEPITSFAQDAHVRYAFLAVLAVTAYSLVDKVAVAQINPILYAYILHGLSQSMFSIYIFKVKNVKKIKKMWHTDKKAIAINGIISAINYPLFLFALTLANVSYVTGFKQISAVLAVIAGGHLLQEKNWRIRLAASILIALGAILISQAG